MSQLKILTVDDEKGILFLLEKVYQKKGHIMLGATDGITGIEIFKKERPDITFIDIYMPNSPIDGIKVLKCIKEIDKNARCVMITRIREEKSISQTRELGALHYITKPFEMEDLDKCIAEVQAIPKRHEDTHEVKPPMGFYAKIKYLLRKPGSIL